MTDRTTRDDRLRRDVIWRLAVAAALVVIGAIMLSNGGGAGLIAFGGAFYLALVAALVQAAVLTGNVRDD